MGLLNSTTSALLQLGVGERGDSEGLSTVTAMLSDTSCGDTTPATVCDFTSGGEEEEEEGALVLVPALDTALWPFVVTSASSPAVIGALDRGVSKGCFKATTSKISLWKAFTVHEEKGWGWN